MESFAKYVGGMRKSLLGCLRVDEGVSIIALSVYLPYSLLQLCNGLLILDASLLNWLA